MFRDNLRILKNTSDSQLHSTEALDDEYVITSGHARFNEGTNKINGELIVTNKRILFYTKSNIELFFGLDEIESVKSNKSIFAFKDCLTIVANKKKNVFYLNYSEDWFDLIESLLGKNTSE